MNILDTRDLYQEMQDLNERQQTTDEDDDVEPLDDDEETRLGELVELFDEIGEDAGIHGGTLIPEADFEDYAQETAEDLGLIQRGASWPNNCIDWEQAAAELSQDYTSLTFDGEDYYYQGG